MLQQVPTLRNCHPSSRSTLLPILPVCTPHNPLPPSLPASPPSRRERRGKKKQNAKKGRLGEEGRGDEGRCEAAVPDPRILSDPVESSRNLLVPDRRQRIRPHGPPGGDPAGDEGDRGEHQGDQREGDRVSRL